MSRAAAVFLLLVAGCTESPTGPRITDFRELDRARERWADAAIGDYEFTYTKGCFCPQLAVRVTVRDGIVTAIRDLVADTTHVPPLAPLTIGSLFDTLAVHLAGKPAAFSARYDPITGAPLDASFDPIANAVDDEWGFSVSGFTTPDP